MKISSKSWKSYIERLSRIDQKAASAFADWFREHPDADTDDLLNYAFYTSDYYGNAASELACEMYDEVAVASGKTLPPAEPARTATYGEVAKAIQGKLLTTQDPDAVGSVVGTKVKTVGLDTLLKNSFRDGAEFAWIPSGDTCAFCMMLASNGWQKASKKALKNGHASHVHNNCNCTYAIRFDENTEVEGYDPDYYKDQYDNAEGDNWKDKVNSMRREHYAANKESINEQKRVAYEKRNKNINPDVLRITQIPASTITQKVQNGDYSLKLSKQQYNKHILGTMDYDRYEASRNAKGLGPQGRLSITFDEAQKIIENKSGTGIIKVRRDGTPTDVEWITCEKIIGSYNHHGKWYSTNKAMIMHGKKGSHLVPHKGSHYD